MFFLPVPVKMLFSDFPTEISLYTISGSYTCKGFYDNQERYIVFPLDECPEITKGTEIKSQDGTVFIAKSIETGGMDSNADALVVHI